MSTPETQTITDLSDLCAPAVPVPLFGTRYWVPGRPPLDWDFTFQELERHLNQAVADGDNDAFQKRVDQLREHIVDLLAIRQPEQRAEINQHLGQLDLGALVQSVRVIYSGVFAPDAATASGEEGAAPPTGSRRRTSAKAAGTKKTTSSRPSRSRSRSSR